MTFHPAMQTDIRGIRPSHPLRFRAWQGVVADFWRASGLQGGGGDYLSPHPRIVLFLDDGADAVELTGSGQTGRGLSAIYVPAGLPVASRIIRNSDFAHVDLHLQEQALIRRLMNVRLTHDLRQSLFLGQTARLRQLASLIAAEIDQPSRAEMMMEGLLLATLSELFEARPDTSADAAPAGGLTPYQMATVTRFVEQRMDRTIAVAELAEAAGLSESWFAHAFKNTTGQSPHRWQIQQRISAATALMQTNPALPLAEIAAATGFSDQAHFTRAFRAQNGLPPGAWRRRDAAQPETGNFDTENVDFGAESFK